MKPKITLGDKIIDLINRLEFNLLTIFIVLKLIGLINWSWVWVLSPFWIILICNIIFFVLYHICIGIYKCSKKGE